MKLSHPEGPCTSSSPSLSRTPPRHHHTSPWRTLYQTKKNTLKTQTKLHKPPLHAFETQAQLLNSAENTCAIEGSEDWPRRLGVEQDEGIFGISRDHVLEAPRERVRAFLAFIDGHNDPTLVCRHVIHRIVIKLFRRFGRLWLSCERMRWSGKVLIVVKPGGLWGESFSVGGSWIWALMVFNSVGLFLYYFIYLFLSVYLQDCVLIGRIFHIIFVYELRIIC